MKKLDNRYKRNTCLSKYSTQLQQMKFEYKIEENDFLEFQLFAASKSKRIMKKKKIGWILLTTFSLIFGLLFYFQNNFELTVYCGFSTLICGLFFPKYFNWRLKKHYKNFIEENYQKRFGEIEKLEFTKDHIYTKDKTGEGKIKLKEIEGISETKNHFFLKISTGMFLMIPKREIDSLEIIRTEFKAIGLEIIDELNWEWK